MDAYVVVAPEQGSIVQMPDPKAGPGQALIRVLSNGICASDLPIWAERQDQYPIYFGHEPVGEVIATGPGLSLPAGTVVTGRISPSL